MTLWTFRDIKRALGRSTAGPDFDVTGLSIDTRTLQPGDLFVALTGARSDGHDYATQAIEKGAAALLVSTEQPGDTPQIVVDDTLAALAKLAAAKRDWCRSTKRVAITGSVGKTSVKEMLAHVLGCHKSLASYNNHIGVPLTLATLPQGQAYGVFEVGMNHPGEIAPLSELVQPDVAVVTTVAPAHIGAFGSIDDIAVEKTAIFAGLKPSGVAITHVDTYQRFKAYFPVTPLTFSLDGDSRADVKCVARSTSLSGQTLVLDICGQQLTLSLPQAEEVLAINALAVITICHALGVDLTRVARRLETVASVPGRWHVEQVAGVTVVDDSYNANPKSMAASLKAFGQLAGVKRRTVFLGEMRELGVNSDEYHQALAPLVAGCDRVICVGAGARPLYDILPESLEKQFCQTVLEIDLARTALDINPSDAVLVKGSKGVFWQYGFVPKLKKALQNR